MSQTATTKTESGKVIPDEGTLDGDFELTANDKVQLDLDDAPFLHDPDEEEAPLPFFPRSVLSLPGKRPKQERAKKS